MARRDLLASVALVLLAIGYGALTAALPERTMPNTPGPSFFPWLVTGSLVTLSLSMLVRSVVRLRSEPPSPQRARPSVRAAGMLAWFTLYLIVLPNVGFIIASVPFFAGLMFLYGARSWYLIVGVSLAVPSAIYVLFRHAFLILLPDGPW